MGEPNEVYLCPEGNEIRPTNADYLHDSQDREQVGGKPTLKSTLWCIGCGKFHETSLCRCVVGDSD